MNIKKDIRFRVYVAFTGICLLGLAIIVKAAMIQVKEGPELRQLAHNMHTRTTLLPAERGNIYTEKGELLCSTVPQFDVHIDFSVIKEKLYKEKSDTLATCLAALFRDRTAIQYKQLLDAAYKKKGRYVLLRKNMKYYDYQAVRSFPIFNKGKAYGGFIEDPKIKRVNPYQTLAYRTIGLWRENSQIIGLEKQYDSILRGEQGSRIEQKAVGNVWVPLEGSEVETKNGSDIVTTLDIGIQEVAEYSLMSTLEKFNCQYGTCIVMEVATGKIKALVNLGIGKDGNYYEDFNYALMPTEPGSTFKMTTLYSLFKDGLIDTNTIVNAEGGAKLFYKRTMHDSHHGTGAVTVKKAFAVSSNVAMAKMADQHYHNNPSKYLANLKKLHIGEKTGIDIPGERKPVLKSPSNTSWSATTLPWMATGYEVLVSPMRTCMIYNAVANNGKMMKPYLVSSIREYGKDVVKVQPTCVEEIADMKVIKKLQACAEEVVLSGTAKQFESPFYTMAGKTGTALVADKGISYAMHVYQGSFVGYVPADKPKYTIAVVVRTKAGSSAYYGGTIAAPVFKMIADRIFATGETIWSKPIDSLASISKKNIIAKRSSVSSYEVLMRKIGLNVPAITGNGNVIAQIVSDSNKHTSMISRPVYLGQMPDVTGMGLKDAIYLLEQQGAKVFVTGRGRVRVQSIPAGSRIVKGQRITLQLS